MFINPNLQVAIRKKATLYVNNLIKSELSDPMRVDYYKGYRDGLIDAPCFSCSEAFELLSQSLNTICDDNLKDKITSYLNRGII